LQVVRHVSIDLGDQRHALVDVMGAGRLMMTKGSFGFTQEKSVRWYVETGRDLGTIAMKDPIRYIYQRGDDTIIETRQRRAVIQGMPSWW
jgi:hypothetical protein